MKYFYFVITSGECGADIIKFDTSKDAKSYAKQEKKDVVGIIKGIEEVFQ